MFGWLRRVVSRPHLDLSEERTAVGQLVEPDLGAVPVPSGQKPPPEPRQPFFEPKPRHSVAEVEEPVNAPTDRTPRQASPQSRTAASLPRFKISLADPVAKPGHFYEGAKAGRRSDARWVPPGRLVTVSGFEIPRGMIYIGRSFEAAPREWQDTSRPSCFIDPNLKVAAAPAKTPGDLSYWPSYSGITPLQRSTYLTWLASGARDGSVPVGYAFLYFYGLERRLIRDQPGQEEEVMLVAEVERLQSLYGSDGSFSSCSRALLDLVRLREVSRAPGGLEAWSPDLTLDQPGFEMPLLLRAKLALHAVSRTPLDFRHTMAGLLAMRHQGTGISSTVGVSRTWELFLDLAQRRFAERWPRGFQLTDNRRSTMLLAYRPATQSQPLEVRVDGIPRLPDPATLAWSDARELFNGAATDLGTYAKLVREGRYPADSLIAALSLPPELADTAAALPVITAKKWLETLSAPVADVSLATLGRLCFGPGKEEGAVKQPREVSAMLARLGFGMEPDPAHGGEKPAGNVLLFKDVGASGEQSPSFHRAALVASVFAAGHGADPARFVPELAIRLKLTAGEGVRLAARQKLANGRGPTAARLKREAAALSEQERGDVVALATSVATAVGDVGSTTIASLERLYDTFGLERRGLYAALHGGAAAQALPAAEPVVVESRTASGGAYRIPSPPVDTAAVDPQGGLVIDMAKVIAIKLETEKVAELLAAVYEEEEAVTPPPPASTSAVHIQENERFPGLEQTYAQLLDALCKRATWLRTDYEMKASDFGLMPNAALEVINDWSYEVLGDALIEDGDVLAIDMALFPGERAV